MTMTKKSLKAKVFGTLLPSTEPLIFDFIFIGNEHPIKGMDKLEEIIQLVAGRNTMCCIGKLPELSYRYSDIPGISFPGEVIKYKKYLYLVRSKVLCLTSYHESFSMVACEALYAGVPVVAFDIPTLRSVYKQGVHFVEYGNTEAMYNKMCELSKDIETHSKIAEQEGRRFKWDKELEKILCEL